MNKEKKICLIKSNLDIKQLLFDRITEMGLTYSEVVQDAREKHGRKFTLAMLSRYFSTDDGQLSCQLTQPDVVWMCDRYGIDVTIMVKKLKYVDKTVKQKLKRKYV